MDQVQFPHLHTYTGSLNSPSMSWICTQTLSFTLPSINSISEVLAPGRVRQARSGSGSNWKWSTWRGTYSDKWAQHHRPCQWSDIGEHCCRLGDSRLSSWTITHHWRWTTRCWLDRSLVAAVLDTWFLQKEMRKPDMIIRYSRNHLLLHSGKTINIVYTSERRNVFHMTCGVQLSDTLCYLC